MNFQPDSTCALKKRIFLNSKQCDHKASNISNLFPPFEIRSPSFFEENVETDSMIHVLTLKLICGHIFDGLLRIEPSNLIQMSLFALFVFQ